MVGTPEYNSWRGMIERCENPRHRGYANYGKKGIRVCRRWRLSFLAFLEDMGLRPGPGYSIERERCSCGYCKSNCRWATKKEQARNKSNNRRITAFGRTQALAAWAEETGMNRGTILSRLDRDGLEPEEALSRETGMPRKNTRWLECAGRWQSVTAWAKEMGMSRAAIMYRVAAGIPINSTKADGSA